MVHRAAAGVGQPECDHRPSDTVGNEPRARSHQFRANGAVGKVNWPAKGLDDLAIRVDDLGNQRDFPRPQSEYRATAYSLPLRFLRFLQCHWFECLPARSSRTVGQGDLNADTDLGSAWEWVSFGNNRRAGACQQAVAICGGRRLVRSYAEAMIGLARPADGRWRG